MSVRANVLLWAQRTIARKGSPPHVLLEVAEQATGEQVQEAFHKIARTSHPDLHRTGLNAEELELVTSAYAAIAGAYQQMRFACMKTARIALLKQDELAKVGAVTPPDSKPVAPVRPPTPAPRAAAQTPPTGARTVVSSTEVGPRPRHPSSDPPSTRKPSGDGASTRTPSGDGASTRKPSGDGASTRRPSSEPPATRRPSSEPPATRRPSSEPRAGTDSDSPISPHVAATPSGAAPSAIAAQAMSAKALLYYRKAELCLKRGDLRGAVLQLKLACAADPNSGFLRTALAEVETEVRRTP
jgi:hypothetical protein